MKKIFTIASYDFKRLVLNPISAIVYIILAIALIITGFAVKIPTSQAYSAQINGATVTAIYTNFNSSTLSQDTQTKLDSILDETRSILTTQNNSFSTEFAWLSTTNNSFQSVKYEIKKTYDEKFGESSYTKAELYNKMKNSINELSNFVTTYQTFKEFETKLIFTKTQFSNLQTIALEWTEIVSKSGSDEDKLYEMYQKFDYFNDLQKIVNEVEVFSCDSEVLNDCQQNCVDVAQAKNDKIYAEIQKLYNTQNESNDIDQTIAQMKSLITNYKLTCESAKEAVSIKLRHALEKHFGNLNNLQGFEKTNNEEESIRLAKSTHFLNDESLYYTQYQAALNFYTASYEVTMFDHAYFITSIVGFLVILFGIFCAYKLFGRDRKIGKMDALLSKNVTFGQVFAGKFLAIIFSTTFLLALFASLSLLWGTFFYTKLSGSILAVFNLKTVYTIKPIWFFFIKILGIELQAIFYSTITVFVMNLSRKFELGFTISLLIFALATVCNIFLNGSIVYCLLPFIHADITSFIGGATMQTGFLKTSLYTYGNFFISLAYYLVVVILLYNFTKQLFKKN